MSLIFTAANPGDLSRIGGKAAAVGADLSDGLAEFGTLLGNPLGK